MNSEIILAPIRVRPAKAAGPAAAGLVLVVQVRSAGQKDKAQRIPRAYGAAAIRVHEIEIEKRCDDVPSTSPHVEPWLGEHGYLGDF